MPGEFRQNHKSGEVKPYQARPADRAQVKRWKAELEALTQRQQDRAEAVRVHQQEQARATERARREEARQAAAEEEGIPIQNPASRFVVRSVGISHLDSGFRRADDEDTQAVYRISQIQTIRPAELVRETEMDPELEFVRQALLSNQLGSLPIRRDIPR